MNNRLVLDCTLRDGGYVNNWQFDSDTVISIVNNVYDAGIRFIELGIMGKGGERGKSTKFESFSDFASLLKYRKKDCTYAIMITQSEAKKFNIPKRSNDTIDLIRIAFFKNELDDAIDTAKDCLLKGYKVFLQAMATFMYSEDELYNLIEKINNVKPDGFYIVDSFSTMYNSDVRKLTDFVLAKLDNNIILGFHAHNNIQMAYSNVIEFFNTKTPRTLIADGSIFGMGRGAGNVPIELILEYLNKFYGTKYNIISILNAFESNIKNIFKEYYWGFSEEYYLTASKNINSVYGWYLKNQNIESLDLFNDILDLIPEHAKYTLIREEVQKAINMVKK